MASDNDHSNGHDLKSLQDLWYSKLAEEGFKDIENSKQPGCPLSHYHSTHWQKTPIEKIQHTQEYYQRARSLLHTYKFKNSIHRTIWELHSEGLSKYKIEKAISDSSRPYKRESIDLIIKLIAKAIL